MTRFLCVGDLHIGAGPDYGREPGDRLRDQEQVWARVLELAVEHDVDAVLFAGDAFHRRRPVPAELRAFQRPLERFTAEHDIEVLAINGNHDVEAAQLPSALELFASTVDLHVQPGVWLAPGGVAVATLPWTPAGPLVAARDGGDRDDTHAIAARLLVGAARELRDQVGGPCVLMLHWSLSEAVTPTGTLTDTFRETVVSTADLAGLGFDAVVAGHIHKAQLLVQDPPIFFTGSPLPVDFGEANVGHGVWILDVDGAAATAEYVPVESRPFVTIDLEADEAIAVSTGDHDFSARREYDDAVVRVRYIATEEQGRRIAHHAIRDALLGAGAHKVYAIQADIVREQRARVEGVDEDVAPLDAVSAWCATNGTAPDALLALTAVYLETAAA